MEKPRLGMEVPSPGGGDVRSVCEGSVDLHQSPPEHCRAIYRNKTHYGPVSCSGVVPRSLGFEAVVGTGGTRYKVYTGGGSGGRGG